MGKLAPAGGTVVVRTNPAPSQGSANRVSVNSNQTSSLPPKSTAMNGTGDSLRSVTVLAVPNVVGAVRNVLEAVPNVLGAVVMFWGQYVMFWVQYVIFWGQYVMF